MIKTKIKWSRKHLLGLADLSATEITTILDTAGSFKEVSTRNIKKVPALRGKVVVNMFVEPSTRTKTSFSLAAKRLSADIVDFSSSSSSLHCTAPSFSSALKYLTAAAIHLGRMANYYRRA